MGKFSKYIKKGIKYILYDYKQPIVKAEIIQKKPSELFKNKVYIVTGGGSGIGFSIAKKLIEEGAFIIITGRNENKLIDAKKVLGENCNYYVSDISDIKNSRNMIKEVFEKYKVVSGIINNAGISLHEWDYMKVDEEKFDKQLNINLKGSYFFTQQYIEEILNRKINGNVVFISSEAGTMCDDLPYGLSKASINSLVKSLSYNYYKDGIRVNAISPGVTASSMTKVNKEDNLYSDSNSGRIFLPEEIAEVVCFILSDYSKCISGEIIHTNGGNHIKKRY